MAKKKTTQQLIKNPAWRSKVDDKTLKRLRPDLYEKRRAAKQMAQEDATIYSPGAIVSGRNLRRMVNSMVDAETRPAMASLDRDIAKRQAQGTEMQGLSDSSFDRVVSQLAGNVTAAQGRSATLNAEQAARQTATQDKIKAATEAVRGNLPAGSTMNAQVDANLAAQQTTAATLGASAATSLARQLASQEGLMQAMQGAATVQKGESYRGIQDKTMADVSELQGKRSDLVTSRGALRSKFTNELRQQMFNNAAVAKNFDLKEADLAADVADDAADNKIAQQRAATAERNADIAAGRLSESQRHNRVTEAISRSRAAESRSAATGKDAFGNTPRQQRSAQEDYTKALTMAKTYDVDGKTSESELYQLLVSPQGGNLTPSMAKAAAQMVKIGRVGPKTAATLRGMGVSQGLVTGRRKPTRAGGARTS